MMPLWQGSWSWGTYLTPIGAHLNNLIKHMWVYVELIPCAPSQAERFMELVFAVGFMAQGLFSTNHQIHRCTVYQFPFYIW